MGSVQPVSAPLRAALGRLSAIAEIADGDPLWPWLAAAAVSVLQDTQPPYEPVTPLHLEGPVDAAAEIRRALTEIDAAVHASRSGPEAMRCTNAAQQLRAGLDRYGPAGHGGQEPAAG